MMHLVRRWQQSLAFHILLFSLFVSFCVLTFSCFDIFAFFTFCLPDLSHFPTVCRVASHHLSCHPSHIYHSYASPCYRLTVQTPSSLALSLPLTFTTFLVVPAHSLDSD